MSAITPKGLNLITGYDIFFCNNEMLLVCTPRGGGAHPVTVHAPDDEEKKVAQSSNFVRY